MANFTPSGLSNPLTFLYISFSSSSAPCPTPFPLHAHITVVHSTSHTNPDERLSIHALAQTWRTTDLPLRTRGESPCQQQVDEISQPCIYQVLPFSLPAYLNSHEALKEE